MQSLYGTIYEMDEHGRVLSETRGIKEYGRPRGKGADADGSFLGKWVGNYSQGAKKVVAWKNEYGERAITIKGGIHNVTFGFEFDSEYRKFVDLILKLGGYSTEIDHHGATRVYLPITNRNSTRTGIPSRPPSRPRLTSASRK